MWQESVTFVTLNCYFIRDLLFFEAMAPKRTLGKLALALLFVAMAPTFVPQAGASSSHSLHEKTVSILLQANLGMMSRGRLTSEADGIAAACEGLPASCLQAALAKGWPRQVEKPRTQLRAWDLSRWWSWSTRKHESVSIIGKLVSNKSTVEVVVSIAGIFFVIVQVLQGWATIRRARLDSDEGRVQAAVKRMMEPYKPKKKKKKKPVVHRKIFDEIKDRVATWNSHATIVAGRYGSGKSVAVREALQGVQGVFVHTIEGADWKDELYKRLGLAGRDMLEEVLCRVQAQLEKLEGPSKVPIIVLDIPRKTREGAALVAFKSFRPCLLVVRHGRCLQLCQVPVL